MKEYKRDYPFFSLCGLNCGLCPRFHTDGESKCPGCGGENFHLKHPACSVISCNKKRDNVQFCFQCKSYPCDKYHQNNNVDSFISYKNVHQNLLQASEDLKGYQFELERKINFLSFLLANFNDGRKKNFYCLAVNLLPLSDLEELLIEIRTEQKVNDRDLKKRIEFVVDLINSKAIKNNIELKLRK